MSVLALDHVNITCADLAGTARFYAELLDLEERDGPPPTTPDRVRWMHDAAGRPILHLNAAQVERPTGGIDDVQTGGSTGAVHHVALECSKPDDTIARLDARGAEYRVNRVESLGLTQVFTRDPNDVLLELNFRD